MAPVLAILAGCSVQIGTNQDNSLSWKFIQQTWTEESIWNIIQEIKKTWFEIMPINSEWNVYINYDLWFSINIPKNHDHFSWEIIGLLSGNEIVFTTKEYWNRITSIRFNQARNTDEVNEIMKKKYPTDVSRKMNYYAGRNGFEIELESENIIWLGNDLMIYSADKMLIINLPGGHDPNFWLRWESVDWIVRNSFKFLN